MAKKIKFALALPDGANVRTLEDLQEHFDLEAVSGYFMSGKLLEWLEDRYYSEEAEQIRAIDQSKKGWENALCDALGVEHKDSATIDPEEIAALNEKKSRLRQITDDEDILSHAAQAAFTQEELADLLDAEEKTIYLCGDSFRLPWLGYPCRFVGVPSEKVKVTLSPPPKGKEVPFLTLENIHLKASLRKK